MKLEKLEPRVFLSAVRPAYNTGEGFFVLDGNVYDANGEEFVMQGPNAVHAWGSYNGGYLAIDHLAKTGANAVRAVMYQDIASDTGNPWTDSADTPARRRAVVERYIANGMVVIAEDHASIADGGSVQSNKIALDEITQHWIDNQSWLQEYEKYVIINIANEWGQPAGNTGTNHTWRDAYIDEVLKLRRGPDTTLGTSDDITNLIMIDAGQWGQDYNTLRHDAQAIQNADPQHNIVFSIHNYGQWRDESRAYELNQSGDFGPWDIATGLTQMHNAGLPLVVGEWAWEDFKDFSSSGAPFAAYRTQRILQLCDQLDIGYFTWSWNQSSPLTLNMVSGNLSNYAYNTNADISAWGDLLINDPTYGFKASAKRASIYSDPLPVMPAPPAPLPPLPASMNSDLWIVLEKTQISVPETGQAAARVRLSKQPASNVVINLTKSSGDASVNLITTSLTFTPANWDAYQPILVSASADGDTTNGTARFQLASTALVSNDFAAKEIDSGLPLGAATLAPTADRFYNGSGANTTLTVTTSQNSTMFMKFDLSGRGGKVASALLRVFKTTATTNLSMRVFHAVSDNWTEGSSTGIFASYPVITSQAVPNAAGFVQFDVTSIVAEQLLKDASAWNSIAGTICLAIRFVSGSGTFQTREGTTDSQDPQLVVTTVEATPPQVTASSFEYLTGPSKLSFTFSEDVSASLSSADVLVQSLTDPNVTLVLNSPLYDGVTNTATFEFLPSLLPDGDYRATLLAAGVSDLAGNAMLANSSFDFFSLAGDTNRDRLVDITDLGTLASNWQLSGKLFSDGDFNGDGMVDITDLGMLATNWQKSLPLPQLPQIQKLAPARKATWAGTWQRIQGEQNGKVLT